MADKITKLTTAVSADNDLVIEMLERAIKVAKEDGFTSVSVVMQKHDTVWTSARFADRLALLGAIEKAKHSVAIT